LTRIVPAPAIPSSGAPGQPLIDIEDEDDLGTDDFSFDFAAGDRW
jgi:hypothetical protein